MFETWIHRILLQIEPEKAHFIAQQLLRMRYSFPFSYFQFRKPIIRPVRVFGLDFINPIGIAAGWDKKGDCIDALFQLGFGFVEVGTVTPKPQAGNPKPRLFRIPEKKALINRMGFNNDGIDALVEKIKYRKSTGILGVNIGKNRETQLGQALYDYQLCLSSVYPYADYIVINISSPNTPDLRSLQSEHYLYELLNELNKTRNELAIRYQQYRPLIVKTTIDLPASSHYQFIQTLFDNKIDGCIISNTTINHEAVIRCKNGLEKGGLSGEPLREKTTKMIESFVTISERKLPIIGVGGILSGEDAVLHFQAGASLLQLYTGFVYRGSELIGECIRQLFLEVI